jgi:DNA-binding LacI/PurR family transcriptional regulator
MIHVAKHSGVSHQTVSRVLNGNKNVSEKTRTKVLASIQTLGYTRNPNARALVTGKTFTIGVLSLDSELYGPTSMLHAIQTAAKDEGYAVILSSVRRVDSTSLLEGIEELTSLRVDGIVLIAPQSADMKELEGFNSKLPVVSLQSLDSNLNHTHSQSRTFLFFGHQDFLKIHYQSLPLIKLRCFVSTEIYIVLQWMFLKTVTIKCQKVDI